MVLLFSTQSGRAYLALEALWAKRKLKPKHSRCWGSWLALVLPYLQCYRMDDLLALKCTCACV